VKIGEWRQRARRYASSLRCAAAAFSARLRVCRLSRGTVLPFSSTSGAHGARAR